VVVLDEPLESRALVVAGGGSPYTTIFRAMSASA
jgi:hypothetical protein